MQNKANLPLAVTGLAFLIAGIFGVVAVVAGYRSETLLGASCACIVFGILGVVAAS
jgi:hypothetical protein